MKGKIYRWPEKSSPGFVETDNKEHYRIISKGLKQQFPDGLKKGTIVDFHPHLYGSDERERRLKQSGVVGEARLIPPKPTSVARPSRNVRLANESRRQHAQRYFGDSWSTLTKLTTQENFFVAIKVGSFGRVATLLEGGKNPNQTSQDDMLPLCVALNSKQWEIAKLLMIYGADPEAQNARGVSANYVVQERGGFGGCKEAQAILSSIHSSSRISSPATRHIQSETSTFDNMSGQRTLPSLTSPNNDYSKDILEVEQLKQETRDPLDGSRGVGSFARNFDGQFGSHSGFDDYGEESSP